MTLKRWGIMMTTIVAGILFAALALSVVILRAEKADFMARLADYEMMGEEFEREWMELRWQHDLAVEFGFNPLIVDMVIHEAKEALDDPEGNDEEFRLIQTHEYLTHIFLSLIYTESRGNPAAVGDKGKARGLTQIWLSTAREYSDDVTAAQLLDPGVNIEISFIHFRHLLTKYRGNFTLALLAWNRGKGRVDELIAWGESPANGFGARVFSVSSDSTRVAVATSVRQMGRR